MPNGELSRRSALCFGAVGVLLWAKPRAILTDFWNEKPVDQWTTEEIDRLITQSPWAMMVDLTQNGAAPPKRRGLAGALGQRGGGRGTQNSQAGQAIVRWESAQPILDALKVPLPGDFLDHYAISVSGVPVNPSAQRGQDDLEALKAVTSLETKDKGPVPPVALQELPSANGMTRSVLFGFSKESLPISVQQQDATFHTRIENHAIQARFTLGEMLYLQKLAL